MELVATGSDTLQVPYWDLLPAESMLVCIYFPTNNTSFQCSAQAHIYGGGQ